MLHYFGAFVLFYIVNTVQWQWALELEGGQSGHAYAYDVKN